MAARLTAIFGTLAVAATLVGTPASPEVAAAAASERHCYGTVVSKRKTSVGVHQWTIRQIDNWCARGGRIVSIRQSLELETGSGWRLISKRGSTGREGRSSARTASRWHFRLRYSGGYEQNCYPRITGRLYASGHARHELDVGC